MNKRMNANKWTATGLLDHKHPKLSLLFPGLAHGEWSSALERALCSPAAKTTPSHSMFIYKVQAKQVIPVSRNVCSRTPLNSRLLFLRSFDPHDFPV